MKQFTLLLITALFINMANLTGQNTVVAGSGNAIGTNGSASFSIGVSAYKTGQGTTGSITQGIQQFNYIISISTGVELSQINLKCFPNPVQDYLVLDIEDTLKDFSYKLTDINGRLITSEKIADKTTTIPMNSIPKGIYFIKITENKKEIKVFKIVKK